MNNKIVLPDEEEIRRISHELKDFLVKKCEKDDFHEMISTMLGVLLFTQETLKETLDGMGFEITMGKIGEENRKHGR